MQLHCKLNSVRKNASSHYDPLIITSPVALQPTLKDVLRMAQTAGNRRSISRQSKASFPDHAPTRRCRTTPCAQTRGGYSSSTIISAYGACAPTFVINLLLLLPERHNLDQSPSLKKVLTVSCRTKQQPRCCCIPYTPYQSLRLALQTQAS